MKFGELWSVNDKWNTQLTFTTCYVSSAVSHNMLNLYWFLASWHPANISCFPRRFEGVFSVTLFVFQDVLKTSWRRLEDVFAIRLPKMSSRRLQDVLQDVFKTFSRRVCKTSCNYVFKTSSRRLQYVFTKTNVCWACTTCSCLLCLVHRFKCCVYL